MCFTYLGKTFSNKMSVDKVKAELISDFNSYIDTINLLPLSPKNKSGITILIWHFSIYMLSEI